MKKLLFLLPLFLIGLGFTACNFDGSDEYHQITFHPLTPGGRVLYADQSYDTVRVVSTDSWTLEARAKGTAWFTLSPTSAKVPAKHISSQRVEINTTPNTTGKARSGLLALTPTGVNLGSLGLTIVQYPWLDILRPAPFLTNEGTLPVFAAQLQAAATEATVVFRLHTLDLTTASFTSDAEWCAIPTMPEGLKRGVNEVKLNLTPNKSKEQRTARLTLTSSGVSTVITLTQAGEK